VKGFRSVLKALDGCSFAAFRLLVTRGPAAARRVISDTLASAGRSPSVHAVSSWALARGFAVDEKVVIDAGSWFDGSIAPMERYMLAHLVRHFKPRNLLEVGTFRGTTSCLLLDNMARHARLFTIDLPPQEVSSDRAGLTDAHLIRQRHVGADMKEHPRFRDVVQVLGSTYEQSTWKQIPPVIDFAFIDASHSYEAVRNDTERVRQKLTNNGVIVWHDYTEGESLERGVGRYIRERMKQCDDIFVCLDTNLAIRIPSAGLLEAEGRIAKFFPEGDYYERCPAGAFPWLRKLDTPGR